MRNAQAAIGTLLRQSYCKKKQLKIWRWGMHGNRLNSSGPAIHWWEHLARNGECSFSCKYLCTSVIWCLTECTMVIKSITIKIYCSSLSVVFPLFYFIFHGQNCVCGALLKKMLCLRKWDVCWCSLSMAASSCPLGTWAAGASLVNLWRVVGAGKHGSDKTVPGHAQNYNIRLASIKIGWFLQWLWFSGILI